MASRQPSITAMNSSVTQASTWFWLIAGILIGIAASIAVGGLWQHALQRLGRRRAFAYSAGAVVGIAALATALYVGLGQPDLVAAKPTTAPHAGAAAGSVQSSTAQSMEDATRKLAERLSRDGGTDGDWELLAQSYEFMGRADEAEQARRRLAVATQSTSAPTPEAMTLIAQANELRLHRDYAKAIETYERIIALDSMTADSWADYADTLASANRNKAGAAKLAGAPAQAIDKSLSLNPNHTKALWLKASLAHEEQRFADALSIWRHLREVIGDNENDRRIIDANIAEAQALVGETVHASVVAGTIDIDPKLKSRVTQGATLFVYAKSPNNSGPPLAVYRTKIAKWPIEFRLDDSMAMTADRTLSSAATVIVEARISRTGQAMASPGDLQASGERVDVKSGKTVRLRIDKEVS